MKSARFLRDDSKYFDEFEECRDNQERVLTGELSDEECRALLKKVLARQTHCLFELDQLSEENAALSSHGNTAHKRYIRALEKKLGYYGIAKPEVPLEPGVKMKPSSIRLMNVERLLLVLKATNYPEKPTVVVVANNMDNAPNLGNKIDLVTINPADFVPNMLRGRNVCGLVTDMPLEIEKDSNTLESFRVASTSSRSAGLPVFIDTSIASDRKYLDEHEPDIHTEVGEKTDYQEFIDKYKGG